MLASSSFIKTSRIFSCVLLRDTMHINRDESKGDETPPKKIYHPLIAIRQILIMQTVLLDSPHVCVTQHEVALFF